VIAATILTVGLASFVTPPVMADAAVGIIPVLGAACLLTFIGAADDVRSLGITPRLLAHAATAAVIVGTLPAELRICPIIPGWLESILLVAYGIWFINVVNFMDGLDWMTVAEIVPVTGGLIVLGIFGGLPASAVVVALALLGALLGFAPFNKPVALVFLGDAGSLPIGLLVAWLIIQVAGRGYLAAAMLLPLYYLADATITLLLRLLRRERVTQAHRTHFYQRATDRGLSVYEVVVRVFAINLLLAAGAIATLWQPSRVADIAALTSGALAVACLLVTFARGKS
jgi:UDP-N-acetylmuramyl pentapeptide phosphotransferase/UDP-N-acetylglucosamine-1-phosphate transferase